MNIRKFWGELDRSVDNLVGGHTRLAIVAIWAVAGWATVVVTWHIFSVYVSEFPIWVKLITTLASCPAVILAWLFFHYAGQRWTNNFCTDAEKWSQRSSSD
jgi:hypothetical protein